MTWFGGLVLGLGLLLVATLGGRKAFHLLRLRRERSARNRSYAERLDLKAETGLEDEIDRMVRDLLREHGMDSVVKAAKRALANLDEHDARSRAVWQRVLQAAQDTARRQESDHEAAK
jgi:hypothetical protein